jgi:secreted trypsin-like serine protease
MSPSQSFAAIAIACMGAGCIGELADTSDDGVGADRGTFIVNGKDENGYPSVGMLIGPGICTATLIGKQTVLTAGHCVASPGQYRVRFGALEVMVASITSHPKYDPALALKRPLPVEFSDHDLAVLRLGAAPPSIAPTPIATQPPSIGDSASLVGFGNTYYQASNYGTKRKATSYLSGRSSYRLLLGYLVTPVVSGSGSTCTGDSGGPAFVQMAGREVQVGVLSATNCAGYSLHARIDSQLDWIKNAAGGDLVLASGSSAPTSPAATNKRPDGASCQQPSECEHGLCVGTASGKTFCTRSCPSVLYCPTASWRCVSTNKPGLNVCVPPGVK